MKRLDPQSFGELRFGLFVHFGLYSLLERGEWVMNRERLPRERLRSMAASFTAERFDAGAVCDLAVRAGARYVVLTSMHHEGFCLYRTGLSDFNSWESCGRDLVAEFIEAARERDLYAGLYHSLNDWYRQPDAVDALEDEAAYGRFIDRTHRRVEELVANYEFDILWYDGWWPFAEAGWRGEEMNARLRAIRPGLLFNSRNGAEGDFTTPEQHVNPPDPWRPWEACMTLNEHWGYHQGDDEWKSSKEVIRLLCAAAAGRGNLLLNVGPRGDGSIPEESVEILEAVGAWKTSACGEALEKPDPFSFDLEHRGGHRGDWTPQGPITVSGDRLYVVCVSWAGPEWSLAGLEAKVKSVDLLPWNSEVDFVQEEDGTVRFRGLPRDPGDCLAPVLRLNCDRPPTMYNCGGMRIPRVEHPPYDPMPSDLPG